MTEPRAAPGGGSTTNPAGVRVRYTNLETGAQTVLEMQGDPFEVCDRVQRRLFPVLSEDGWKRMLAERKLRAERERKER